MALVGLQYMLEEWINELGIIYYPEEIVYAFLESASLLSLIIRFGLVNGSYFVSF